MKKYVKNPLTNRFVEVDKYLYKRLVKGGVIEPYVDNKDKKYTISTDEYIAFLKYKKDKNNNLGKSKKKSDIKVKKNDEKLEKKNNKNLKENQDYQYNDNDDEGQIINTEINETQDYQYNDNNDEGQIINTEINEKPVEKPLENQQDLDETNFDVELQKLITLELACPSTDSESEESD